MATVVWNDAFLSIGGTDMSAHVKSLAFSYNAAELDETAMGDGTQVRKGGLKDWSFTVTWNQDFAADGPDAVIFPLVGSTAAVVVRPTSASVSSTNPSFSGTGFFPDYGFGGNVGDLLPANTTIRAAGTLTRATS